MSKLKLRKWDSAEHLKTEEDIRKVVADVLEEMTASGESVPG